MANNVLGFPNFLDTIISYFKNENTAQRTYTLPDRSGTVALEDIVSASITEAVSLDATAFGKLHLCSGTSAAYTIDLPTAVGNEGKTVAFKGVSGMTVAATLAGVSGQTIDGEATGRARLSAGGVFVLMSNGTNWTVVNEVGSWIPFTTTPGGYSANPTFLRVEYFRVGKICTVQILRNASGTGNATTATYSLPFTASGRADGICTTVVDSTLQDTVGMCYVSDASSTLNCFKNGNAGSSWGNPATKGVNAFITYKIA